MSLLALGHQNPEFCGKIEGEHLYGENGFLLLTTKVKLDPTEWYSL